MAEGIFNVSDLSNQSLLMVNKTNSHKDDTILRDAHKDVVSNDYITLSLNTSTFTYYDYLEIAQKIHALHILYAHEDIDANEFVAEIFEFLKQYEGGRR